MSRRVIIGPPGTGKTSYLIGRTLPDGGVMPGIVSDLLRQGHAPESIAFVSYSRAAVREARDRVERCTGIPAALFANFRTLHSSWARRLDLGPNAFLTAHDFRAFAQAIATGITPHDEDETDDGLPMLGDDDGDILLRAYDWTRATMRPLSDAIGRIGRLSLGDLESFVSDYEAFKSGIGKVDHTDIVSLARDRRLTLGCPIVLVDEAQDLSPLQVETLRLSIQEATHVWVVGDPDQAIYEFQGASPAWLRSLWDTWPRQVLDKSNRCPEPVRRAAAMVIANSTDRLPIEYRAREGDGEYHGAIDQVEAMAIVSQAPEACMLLARTGRQCGTLARMLFDARIPYLATRGSGPNPFANTKLVRAITTLADLANGRGVLFDDLAVTLEFVPHDTDHGAHFGWLKHGQKAAIRREVGIFDPRRAEAYDLQAFLEAVQRDFWSVLAPNAKRHADGRCELDYLHDLWASGRWNRPRHEITTWHNAKGREADTVIIDPTYSRPCHDTLMSSEADSEHRAAYVAVTRARRRCFVLARSSRYSYPFPY